MRFHWCKENKGWFPTEGRAWWWSRSGTWRYHLEWCLFLFRFSIGIDVARWGEDTVLFSMSVPGISVYLGVTAPPGSWLGRMVPEHGREIRLAIHDWAVWINPWSREYEWKKSDPWWVRGLVFHIDDFFLGRTKCTTVELKPPERIKINLDGHLYCGTAKFERMTWKRSRWFSRSRDDVWIDMDVGNGLPHSGKGENSWDCGDDALCGWGVEGHDVDKAIQHGIETVEKYRKRYGNPSAYGPSSKDVV